MEREIVIVLKDDSEEIAKSIINTKNWEIRDAQFKMVLELLSQGELSRHEVRRVMVKLILNVPSYAFTRKFCTLTDIDPIRRGVIWLIAIPVSVFGIKTIYRIVERTFDLVARFYRPVLFLLGYIAIYSAMIGAIYLLIRIVNA